MPNRTEPSLTASDALSANRSQSLARWNTTAGIVLIVAAVLVAYCPALWSGFVLDDDKLVTDNSMIRAPDGLYRIWFTTEAQDYWPMTNSSFWLEWRLWEMRATGYHVTNLILHVAAALLIWKILRTLGVPGAFLAALLFAVHPVNVQSVVWISQRKNALAMVFFLLSILWYLQRERGKEQKTKGKDSGREGHGGLVLAEFGGICSGNAQQRFGGNIAAGAAA